MELTERDGGPKAVYTDLDETTTSLAPRPPGEETGIAGDVVASLLSVGPVDKDGAVELGVALLAMDELKFSGKLRHGGGVIRFEGKGQGGAVYERSFQPEEIISGVVSARCVELSVQWAGMPCKRASFKMVASVAERVMAVQAEAAGRLRNAPRVKSG